MRYCSKCILPDTRPNLEIGVDGVCNACKNTIQKKASQNWNERELKFQDVVKFCKSKSTGYDCLVPVSGGKDSTWQIVKCLEYGLNPLAVTWKTPGRTQIGQANLDNLVRLGVDHIDYQVSPKVESKFMLKALKKYGTTALPMHMTIFNIPLTIAYNFNIPLVVYGENSAFEYGGGEDEESTGFQLNDEWIKKYGVTHGTSAEDWVSEDLTRSELTPYFGPNDEKLSEKGIRAIFLGHYFEWDVEESLRVALANGFKKDDGGPRTGYYDYADIDDDFISIHHWIKWYKFGFTRLHDNLSLEIRNGRITRNEALVHVSNYRDQKPLDDIQKFCEFAGISMDEFNTIVEPFRNLDIWSNEEGEWKINDFIIPNMDWS